MSEQEKLIRALGMKIDSLQQTIHMANVQGDSTNNPGGQDVDSILARIINPEEGGK